MQLVERLSNMRGSQISGVTWKGELELVLKLSNPCCASVVPHNAAKKLFSKIGLGRNTMPPHRKFSALNNHN